MQFISLT